MSRLRKLQADVGGIVDGAVLRVLRRRFNSPVARKEQSSHDVFAGGGVQALMEIIAHYEADSTRAAFFPQPPDPVVTMVDGAKIDDGRVVDLSWPSAYAPSFGASDYLAYEANRTAYARGFLHDTPARTSILCLHGYQGGRFFIGERAFAARWFYSLGADVFLFTLPFHGARKDADAPSWPSPNPVRSNEGFGQAIFNLRSLVRWLHSRRADQKIAVLGMSLGGNTASLFGTTDPFDFLGPTVPVASWPELLWSHGEGRAERERAEQEGITLALLQRAMAIVSPLERTPLVAPDRVLVQSARADRIAPPDHALRLAKHFGGVHLHFSGGHVLQLGRRDAFVALAQRMALVGLIDKR